MLVVFRPQDHWNQIPGQKSNFEKKKRKNFRNLELFSCWPPNHNKKYLFDNENHFLYIDRVVIKEEYRRKGIANHLYSLIEEIATESGTPLCCEVNTFPENKPSIEFHKKFGFIEIGKNDFEENSVVYYKKSTNP